MSELLAVLFMFISIVLYRLTRKDKFDQPGYATIKKLDLEEQVQQEALEQMWIEQITKFREILILVVCTYVLAETVIDYFSRQFGG